MVYIWSTSGEDLIDSFDFDNKIEEIHFIDSNTLLLEEISWVGNNSIHRLDLASGNLEKVATMSGISVLKEQNQLVGHD